MTAQDFANQHSNGQKLDNGQGGYLLECVSLVIRYAHDVLGVPYGVLYCSKTQGARDLYEQYDGQIPQYFDRIANDPNDYNQLPQEGDLIVWGSAMGPYGHVALKLPGTKLTVFEQYVSLGLSRVHTYPNYNGVLGWLRPKGNSGSGPGEDMINDQDNEYGRWNKLGYQIRARNFSREEFRNAAVGRTWLQAMEILSDDPEADTATDYQNWGRTAKNDHWDQQISNLQGALKDTQGQLAAIAIKAGLTDAQQKQIDDLNAKNKQLLDNQVAANATGNSFLQWLGSILNSFKK